MGQGQYAEAEPLIVQGYEGMKLRRAKIPPTARPRLSEAAQRAVGLYKAWGKPEKTKKWWSKLNEEMLDRGFPAYPFAH